MKFLFFLLLTTTLESHCQELTVDSKMDIVTSLLDPDGNKYYFKNANPPTKKGDCFLLYHCNEKYFGPYADTFNILARRWISLIENYVIKDSIDNYDTLYVALYAWGKPNRPVRYVAIKLQPTPFITEIQRFKVLTAALPFDHGIMYNDGDSVDLTLHIIPDYSPTNLKRYSTSLAACIFDYVHNRAKISLAMRFIDDKTGAIHTFKAHEDELTKLLKHY